MTFAVFDGNAGQDVRDAGTIGGNADTQLTGQAAVRAGHVGRTGFVARRDQPNAVFCEIGVQSEIGTVDDPEDGIDAFGRQHARNDFSAVDLAHVHPPE